MSLASLSSYYRSILRDCSRAASLQEGHKIHALLIKNGIAASPLAFIYNALLHLYSACDSITNAHQVFDQIPQSHRDVVDWTTLIACYARNNMPAEAMSLFHTMEGEGGLQPDEVTMVSLFSACAQLGDVLTGAWAHLRMIKTGLPFTVTAHNAAMDMYAKCGRMGDARQMFREIICPTVVSWTIILTGILKWEGIMSGRQMFDEMPEKNEFAWTVMITAYVESGFPREAMSLLSQMLGFSGGGDFALVPLNHVTLCSILSACSMSGDLTMGRWIHAHVIKTSLRIEKDEHHLRVCTALVDMYVKCGRIDVARRLFDEMTLRNVVTWNIMLSGLAMHGQGRDALQLFNQMPAEAKPDDITFVAILSACSHSGLVDEGCHYFLVLGPVYGIEPKVEHYACMVDLLGRAGRVEEAEALVREMQIRPNEVVLGALLASCSLHGKLLLGERLLKELVQMDPLNTQYHVLLSNMYAFAGRQRESDSLRQELMDGGIRKTPGMSCIHVGGEVYWFSAGDKSHPQAREVYAMLDEMIQRSRMLGYVPVTAVRRSFNLSASDDEEAERSLFSHSEKLAIAFGLISTRPGVALRIFKNLRICQDCHSFVKLISNIFQREIIIRDRNRFHCFKHGSCSCSDYW
eukprot:TRINITY_DN21661_c0_g1_i1.p1 TRINITY_DN21661_c0_g1~~TRINITY_DN21661_c0_g1_i1.p1  ORF type:complete len:633 (+),score=93.82 TRINITY_DN21661_c0_g1_i1:374-2272(+)